METETVYEYFLHEWNLNQKEIEEPKKIERTKEQKNCEEIVADYYRVEFTVFNVEPNQTGTFKRLPDKVKDKIKEHPLVNGEIPKGFPDLILYDEENDKIAYSEVKLNGDGLRFTQMKFIEKSDRPVSVAFLQEKQHEETIQSRCSTCGATFNTEEKLDKHSCSIDKSVAEIMNWKGYGFN